MPKWHLTFGQKSAKTETEERTVYLLGLVASLFALLALVGLPSLTGVVLLGLALTLCWRLGVIVRRQ